jgi:putative endonuclease
MKNKETGALGEKLAREFLVSRGFTIVDKNYRSPDGEMDIVALKDSALCFVEVRAKTNRKFGSPEESVTKRKKQKLILVAEHYLQNHEPQPANWRIDFVGVDLDATGRVLSIRYIENAVSEE